MPKAEKAADSDSEKARSTHLEQRKPDDKPSDKERIREVTDKFIDEHLKAFEALAKW